MQNKKTSLSFLIDKKRQNSIIGRAGNIDSALIENNKGEVFDLSFVRRNLKNKSNPELLNRKGRSDFFVTEDSKLYFTQNNLVLVRKGEKLFQAKGRFECAMQRFAIKQKIAKYPVAHNDPIYSLVRSRYKNARLLLVDYVNGTFRGVSPIRAWNVAIIGSVVFGMFLMTLFYRYLGQEASAKNNEIVANYAVQLAELEAQGKVLGESTDKTGFDGEEVTAKLIEDYQKKMNDGMTNGTMEKEIREMVKGYPIEKMVPYIAKKDKIVAAFIVGIAKKESNWGRHAPRLDGRDCFNYWGYKSIKGRESSGEYACFLSPEDAVDNIAKRMEFFVSSKKLNTPDKMVVAWKCGNDCSWDNPAAVRKWVSDVDMYYRKFDKFKQ